VKRKIAKVGKLAFVIYHVKGRCFAGRGCAMRALSWWIHA
jgi:hypothetical protein